MNLLLDTNTIINFLKNDNDIYNLPSLFLQHNCLTSVIVKLELLKYPDITQEEEQSINEFLSLIPIIPISLPIENETIKISRSSSLKLPDAIIAATAIIYDAEIVTGDPHFQKCHYEKLKIWQNNSKQSY